MSAGLETVLLLYTFPDLDRSEAVGLAAVAVGV